MRASRVTLGFAVILSVVVLLEGFRVDLFKSSRIPEDAIGCDWFGYLRQARLFRENGLVAGLDTALRDDLTTYLVRVGKRTGEPVASWEHGVAPHCHHYIASTDRVILQYPPGTGFLFSFFPEGTQARWGFVVSDLVVFVALLLATAAARVWTVPFLVLGLGAMIDAGLFRFSEDWSIPLSGAILLLAGWLSVRLSVAVSSRGRVVWASLLGFVLGLSLDVRMMNLIIAGSPMAVLLLGFFRRRTASTLAPAVAMVCGLLIGMLPVFAFNLVNTGHPLRTTYPSYDTSAPVFTSEMVAKALNFYFEEPFNRLFALGALLSIVVVVLRKRLHVERVVEAAASGALAFAIMLGYLLTHAIMVPYYVFPAAAYATASALFALVASENQGARKEAASALPLLVRAGIVVLAGFAAVVVVRRQSIPISPLFAEPARSASPAPSAIVWGDLGTGNVYYFLHRQAATLIELSQPMQERFIAELQKDGVVQYLLNDSERMDTLIGRLAQQGRLRKAARILDYDAYEIVPASESAIR